MKKLVDFLEAYVQWVALGLAILWIGWITYAYWWVSPVTAEFDGQKTTPANINHEVDQSVAIPLEVRIADPNVPFGDHKVANELGRFHNNIEVASVAPEVLGTLQTIVVVPPNTINEQTAPRNALKPDISDVIALYDPAVATGMSRVEIADEKGGKTYKGTTWATVSAEFSQAAFAKAWSDAKIPAAAQLTFFLRVQLVRQEFVEGEWTNSTIIHELPIKGHELPAMPPVPPQPRRRGFTTNWRRPNAKTSSSRPSTPWITAPGLRLATHGGLSTCPSHRGCSNRSRPSARA